MCEYEIIPEMCLKNKNIEYVIGMHICQAISALQRISRIVKGVELIYNSEAPLQQDILINSTQEGIKLYFDPTSQLLRLIEIYDLNKITLKYYSNVFSIPHEKTTVEQVEQAFGATHPGTYDSSLQVYILSWRGISFLFPTDSNVQPLQGTGLGSLHFSPGTAPAVNKISIYGGQSLNDAKVPEFPLSCYNGNCYLESLEILRKNKTIGIAAVISCEGVECQRFAEITKKQLLIKVMFGDDAQKVMSSIGCPNRVFYKSEDKMKIHLPSNQRIKTTQNDRADYFLNYFTLGLDILIDGTTQTVKKFIIHTNYPGHYDFGIYFRCPFSLNINFDTAVYDSESAESDSDRKTEKSIIINPFTKWEDIYDLVSDPLDLFAVSPSNTNDPTSPQASETANSNSNLSRQSPVVLNRTGANNSTNPFGSTFCYCCHDIIFEVMPNNYIASLTLFDDTDYDGAPAE